MPKLNATKLTSLNWSNKEECELCALQFQLQIFSRPRTLLSDADFDHQWRRPTRLVNNVKFLGLL